MLDRLTIPVIVTLHTILETPNDDQRRVMDGLLKRAARVVVMTVVRWTVCRRAERKIAPVVCPERGTLLRL